MNGSPLNYPRATARQRVAPRSHGVSYKSEVRSKRATSPFASGRNSGKVAGDGTLAKELVLFFRNDNKDVCIKCRGQEFWANHVFLCARSSVFRVMLESNFFNEGTTKIIEINDFEPAVIESFLDYVSTDTCSILREGPMRRQLDLYVLADKYTLESLARKCRSKIMFEVKRDNVLEVLDSAELTNCLPLKKKCMEVLQTLRGADMLALIRGSEIWDDVRDMRVRVERMAALPTDNPQTCEAILMCSQYDTIEQLKRKLRKKWELSQFAKLIHSGSILEDDRTVQECGLFEGCSVFLLESGRRPRQSTISAGGPFTLDLEQAQLRQAEID